MPYGASLSRDEAIQALVGEIGNDPRRQLYVLEKVKAGATLRYAIAVASLSDRSVYRAVHMPGPIPARDLLDLRGKTIAQVVAAAIHACFARHNGNRRAMMRELGISKSTLLRRLDELGLRGPDTSQPPLE